MIFRVHKNNNYTALSTHHLRDTSLSWQAMGMLSFMLSCNEDFKFSIEGLTGCSGSGNAATRTALKELRDKGYVVVTRCANEKGVVTEWQYDIYECPADGNPHVEPVDGNPHVEDCRQSNINISVLSKESTTHTISTPPILKEDNPLIIPPIVPRKEKRFVKPTVEEVQAYCAQRKNGINPQHFVDYYESNGWKVGRNPMKDWKAAVRTWECKEKQSKQSQYGNRHNQNNQPSNGANGTGGAERKPDYDGFFGF